MNSEILDYKWCNYKVNHLKNIGVKTKFFQYSRLYTRHIQSKVTPKYLLAI